MRPGTDGFAGNSGFALTSSYLGLLTNAAQVSGPKYREEDPMKASLIRFWRGDSGATAIEYSMIAAGIALAIVASITQLGTTVDGLFVSVLTALK